jgi:hypothetical protein
MEIVAIAGLVALGAAVSQLAKNGATPPAPISSRKEGFHSLGLGISPISQPPSEYYTIGSQQFLTQKEASKLKELNDRLNILHTTGSQEGVSSIQSPMKSLIELSAQRKSASLGTDARRAAGIIL